MQNKKNVDVQKLGSRAIQGVMHPIASVKTRITTNSKKNNFILNRLYIVIKNNITHFQNYITSNIFSNIRYITSIEFSKLYY